MKFTRTLALAAIAAAAVSFTACDDSSPTANGNPDKNLVIDTFSLGSQDQPDLPSVLSIRNNGTIKIADLKSNDPNSENIDLIFFEKDGNSSDVGVFYSPKVLATTVPYSTGTTVAKFTTAAKAIDTKFAYVSGSFSDFETVADLADAVDNVPTSAWTGALDITKTGVVVVKTATLSAVINIKAVSKVPSGTSTAVNIAIAVAK